MCDLITSSMALSNTESPLRYEDRGQDYFDVQHLVKLEPSSQPSSSTSPLLSRHKSDGTCYSMNNKKAEEWTNDQSIYETWSQKSKGFSPYPQLEHPAGWSPSTSFNSWSTSSHGAPQVYPPSSFTHFLPPFPDITRSNWIPSSAPVLTRHHSYPAGQLLHNLANTWVPYTMSEYEVPVSFPGHEMSRSQTCSHVSTYSASHSSPYNAEEDKLIVEKDPLSRSRSCDSALLVEVLARREHRQRRKFTTPDEAIYTCSHCGKYFNRVWNFRAHLDTHDPLRAKPHACVYEGCGKSFVRLTDLIRHRSCVHERIKEFLCGRCGTSFARKDTLTRHEDDGCPQRYEHASRKLRQKRKIPSPSRATPPNLLHHKS